MFPISKYKFYKAKDKVFAVSTFAGKTVKGVAKCDPRDTFDEDYGKELAAARCAEKIAKKRLARAKKKMVDARKAWEKASAYYDDMFNYEADAEMRLEEAKSYIDFLLQSQ